MVKIDGKVVATLKNSLTIDDVIEERSTCSFGVIASAESFVQGQSVEIVDDSGNCVFAGAIDSAKEKKYVTEKIQQIICKDQHYLADKRILAAAYENAYAGDIVKDIVNKKLAEEGVLLEVPIQSQTWLLYRGMSWAVLNSEGGKA